MKKIVGSTLLLLTLSGHVLASESINQEILQDTCRALSNGGSMVNVTQNAEFLFLTDSDGYTHEKFTANGVNVDLKSLGENQKDLIFDGLKYNYDVIACVSPQGKVLTNIGIIKSDD